MSKRSLMQVIFIFVLANLLNLTPVILPPMSVGAPPLPSRDEPGYFAGVFIGHVIGASRQGEDYNRLGAGADLSYHWVGEYTRSIIGVGIGTGFSEKVVANELEPAAPRVFFSFSTALKM